MSGLVVPDIRVHTLDVFGPVNASVGTWTITGLAGALKGACIGSGAAQNDYLAWDLPITAGTYTLGINYRAGTTRGIMSVQFDDVEAGTIDMYAGSTADNVVGSATGMSVATTGLKRLKLKIANKNASSGGYACLFSTAVLVRTA